MHPSELSILESFDQLNNLLQQFTTALLQEAPRCWLQSSAADDTLLTPPQRIAALYGDIWYRDGADGRETQSRCGLVGASAALVELARQVNSSKDQFRAAVKRYKEELGESPDRFLRQRSQVIAEKLERSGIARLHLKQCYRHIPVLDSPPSKVGFNWYTSGRSIKRITLPQAEKMLIRLGAHQPHIQLQLRKLAALPADTLLAQLQSQVPVIRANIVWRLDDSVTRKARNCPLPLLFPLEAEQPFPDYNEPEPEPPAKRQRMERSDLRIDPTPYLPSLRIHRYH